MMRTVVSVTLNLVAIIVCGGAGAFAGYSVAGNLDVAGVAGALIATAIAMIVATLLWAIGTAVIDAIARIARFR